MAKILVVEDDEVLAGIFAHFLTKEGHDVVVRHDAATAANAALEHAPALALIDFNMPGKTGVELLADLRAREATRGLPVLFISGTEAVRFATHVPPEPRVRFLSKPVDKATLLTVVREMLDPEGWSARS